MFWITVTLSLLWVAVISLGYIIYRIVSEPFGTTQPALFGAAVVSAIVASCLSVYFTVFLYV